MVVPYYRQAGITLYHGRCEEILPQLQGRVIITDPPYNAKKNYGPNVNDNKPWPEWCAWWDTILDLCLAAAPDVLAFMSQSAYRKYLRLGRHEPAWTLVWHKPLSLAVCALPFMPHWEPISYWGKAKKRKGDHWGSDVLTCNVSHENAHPTCKPLALMRDLVSRFEGPIIDPFCGSGTTLRAALEQGKEAVGIEINEAFCEMTVQRLERWTSNPAPKEQLHLKMSMTEV